MASLADGTTRWLLRAPALVACGRVSYGLYLYHWPVFIILDEPRTGQSGGACSASTGHDYCVGDSVVRTPGIADPPAGLETSIHRRARRVASAVMLVTAGTIAVVDTDYWRAGRLACRQ